MKSKMTRDKKVWYIIDAEYLFPPGLPFVRWPTEAAMDTPEGEAYWGKIELLKTCKAGLAILGIYLATLRSPAVNTVRARRFFVDDHYKPASIPLITQQIGLSDIPLVRKVLRTLEAVGLLEKVELPNFASVDPGSRNSELTSRRS